MVDALQASKVELLKGYGLLQGAAPLATEFVITRGRLLPDELLTAVQVNRGGAQSMWAGGAEGAD